MYDSRVVRLLKSLSVKEIEDLQEFIQSPFFYKSEIFGTHKPLSREKILQLYKILKNEYPKFNSKSLKDETVFKKIYGTEYYNYNKFAALQHDLLRLIEIFLSYIDILEDSIHPRIHLINQLEKRGLDKFLMSNIDDINKALDNKEIRNEDYYLMKYNLANKKWITNEKYLYLGKSDKNFEVFKEGKKLSENGFLILMLKQLSYLNHYKEHLNLTIESKIQEYIYNYLRENKEILLTNDILNIWFKIILMHSQKISLKKIIELRNLLIKSENLFERSDFEYLFVTLINYCATRFDNGDTNFKIILSEVLRYCLEKNIHIFKNYISEHDYTAYVALTLRLGEFKTAEQFILSYKDYLPPEQRENVFPYNYGIYYYRIKKYDKAIEMLSKVKKSDFFYTIGIYNTLLFIYFETDANESAFNMIDTYKRYLNRKNKIPSDYRIKSENFISFYNDLLKIKMGTDKISPDEFLEKLSKIKEISYKKWLYDNALKIRKPKKG